MYEIEKKQIEILSEENMKEKQQKISTYKWQMENREKKVRRLYKSSVR